MCSVIASTSVVSRPAFHRSMHRNTSGASVRVEADRSVHRGRACESVSLELSKLSMSCYSFCVLRYVAKLAGVDLMRIDGSFPSFSDDDKYILYNEGFTGVSAVARDGSHKQLIFEVCCSPAAAHVYQCLHMLGAPCAASRAEVAASVLSLMRVSALTCCFVSCTSAGTYCPKLCRSLLLLTARWSSSRQAAALTF